jgi:hypothetical protein
MKNTKHTILFGNSNQHTLCGKFKVDDDKEFANISVMEETDLIHEQPNGKFAEHNTLKVEVGEWVMGKQVEFNPFNQSVSQVWD